MSLKKPSGVSEGPSNLFRGAILLVLASSLLALQSTCNSSGTKTEPVPEWDLDEDNERKPDDDSDERDIEVDPIDDPFYSRYA